MDLDVASRRIVTTALVIISFLLVTPLWGLYISIRPPKILSTITPQDLGLKYEDINFQTKDGISIAGWFIPAARPGGAKTIILLHGYPADKGDILPSLSFLAQKYNLLLFDFRYLGQSGGSYSTAGAKEVQDLRAAIQFLQGKDITEVGIWGFSMGGAVALMTAEDTPEIRAIISESSYASLDRMTPELYRLPILKHILGRLTGVFAKILIGVDIEEISPAKKSADLQIPVLVIHSKDDRVISFENALMLKEAMSNNPRAELWFEDNLSHGQFSEKYQQKIEKFFDKNL